ncbi:hypothetical protein BLJ79_03540 [Arthrobacter sp. UCD-GKA]|nr:hypothetical protein BLJ79_03540 [Arthrobacter sp. UCD-GKA]
MRAIGQFMQAWRGPVSDESISIDPRVLIKFQSSLDDLASWVDIGLPRNSDDFADFCDNLGALGVMFNELVHDENAKNNVGSLLCGAYQEFPRPKRSQGSDAAIDDTNSLTRLPAAERLARQFARQAREAEKRVASLNNDLESIRTELSSRSQEIDTRRDEYEVLHNEAKEMAKQYKDLRQNEATTQATKYYDGFRKRSLRGYWLFLSGSIAAFVASGLLSIWFTRDFPTGGDTAFVVSELAWTLVVVSGLIGLATLLAKQSTHFRTLSTWASAIKMQLQTFDSYTLDVTNPDYVEALRAEFSQRVFGAEPSTTGAANLEGSPNSTVSLAPLITEIIRGTQKSSAGKE